MTRTWTLVDFVLVLLGGYFAAAVFAAVGAFLGDEELIFVLFLVGQNAGHLLVFWLRRRSHRSEGTVSMSVEPRDGVYVAVGVGLQLALILLFWPLLQLLPEGADPQQLGSLLDGIEGQAARLTMVLVTAALAPVVEEIIYRGILLDALSRLRRGPAIFLSAVVFAGAHILGLQPSQLLFGFAVVIPRLFLLGLYLGALTLRKGRIGPAVFTHAGVNLLAAVALLLPPDLAS